MYRTLMGLRSGVTELVTEALNALVQISFDAGDGFHASHWPGLAEILWEKIQDVQLLVNDHSKHGRDDRVDHAEFIKNMERVNMAALIVRNLAMNDANAIRFAKLGYTVDILVMCLRLPAHPDFTEFKDYMLDTTDAMASHIQYHCAEKLFKVVAAGLNSDDRGTLISSLRASCRLVLSNDVENRIGAVPFSVVCRITSLLMLEDDDLVTAALDFLYQYTTLEENVERLLAPPHGFELVKHLVRLLLFHGITGEQLVYIKATRKRPPPIYEIPFLPNEIVQDLFRIPEPDRATKWMRCCFEEDPEADVTQIALWSAYQLRFNEFTGQFPLLPAADFIKNVSIAFTTASAMVLTGPDGQNKFIIKGIRARETPMSPKGHIFLACKWSDPNADAPCKHMAGTPQTLWEHVLNAHLPPHTETPLASPLICSWNSCDRFHNGGTRNRHHLVAHVRTHMPQHPAKPSSGLPKEEQEMMDDPEGRVIIRRCQTSIDERGEAAGIPLTSALVLRNIKRKGGELGAILLKAREAEFFEVMAVNQPLAGWVGDLMMDA